MSIKSRMKKSRSSLAKRTKQQIDNKDSSSRSYPTVVDKSKLPEGVEIYRIKEGPHLVDIIPFFVGSDMPLDNETLEPVTEEGDSDYVLDIRVHRNVGSMREQYVCPYQNFREPCPICEYTNTHFLDKEIWKELAPKRRVFYLVWDHMTTDGEKKGVQVMELSHFHMEEELCEIALKPKGGGAIVFADVFEGKQVAWRRKGTGMKNTQYVGHKLVDRDYEIPEGILEQGFALDQVVKMHPTYEEIEKAFQGQIAILEKEGHVQSDDDAGSNFDQEESDMGDDVPEWDQPEKKVTEPKPKPKTTKVMKRKRRFRKK